MRWSWTRAAVLAVLAIALFGCGGDDDEDVQRNEEIVEELPTFPGASEVATESAPYYEEGSEEAKGHTTTVTYKADPGTDAVQVVKFYSSELKPDWRCREERVGVLLLHCARGSELVSINTDNLGADPPRFDVVVDAEGTTQ